MRKHRCPCAPQPRRRPTVTHICVPNTPTQGPPPGRTQVAPHTHTHPTLSRPRTRLRPTPTPHVLQKGQSLRPAVRELGPPPCPERDPGRRGEAVRGSIGLGGRTEAGRARSHSDRAAGPAGGDTEEETDRRGWQRERQARRKTDKDGSRDRGKGEWARGLGAAVRPPRTTPSSGAPDPPAPNCGNQARGTRPPCGFPALASAGQPPSAGQ